MASSSTERGAWGSKIGFILAAAGSAIGLGNIWRFPTVTGENGGAAFVLVYLMCVLVIGVPVMIAEFVVGRRTNSDAVGAFDRLFPGSAWKFVGGLGVFTGLMILSAYTVVAGWILKYIWLTLTGTFNQASPSQIKNIFGSFIGDAWPVILFQAAFLIVTVWIVSGGIQGGIEKASKILMPFLLILLIFLLVRSVTLPGAHAGIEFYLKPDFSKISFRVVMSALGQAFFSLSLGMGAMITYGSYLSKKEHLVSAALWVCLADTLIAFIAGFAIFPALFSVGLDPNQQGPGLIFVVLPNIFNQIPLGGLFGAVFFFLVAIAALTSTIALLEVVVAYLIDERKWTRPRAAAAMGLAAFLIGVPSSLSNGAVPALGGFMDWVFTLFGELSLVVGAFLLCLFVGWKWGIPAALEEIRAENATFSMAGLWSWLIRIVCPVAIGIILIQQTLNLFGS